MDLLDVFSRGVVFLLMTLLLRHSPGAWCQRVVQWQKHTSLIDVSFTGDLMFESTAKSAIECTRKCTGTEGCVSFTFKTLTSASVNCRGHSVVMTSASPSMAAPGTSFFQQQLTVITVPEPTWLGQVCRSNSECPEPQSECFMGQCLCTPGYYYSNSTRQCLADCLAVDLLTDFLQYKRRYIYDNNIAQYVGVSGEFCRNKCLQNSRCRSCEMRGDLNNVCNLARVTPLQVPNAWSTSAHGSVKYWQRMCR